LGVRRDWGEEELIVGEEGLGWGGIVV
jgi:hypothetical protein